ncbi:hypothetical protein MBLNU459_g6807t1 [Dothideomycetes sp. NU459]
MAPGYHVSEPNSYLVITGANVDTVLIKKKAFVMPFQKVTKISITPFDFSMTLQAMTSEKLKFSLPAVFTIGPKDDLAALTKYAVLLTGNSDGQPAAPRQGTVSTGRNHGIIEGETRSIVSTMTMEEIFNKRSIFKEHVIKNVQTELDQFGMHIYNANVKELQDMPGSQYFEFLSKKAHEGAQSQAKVDVANARMIGEIGEAERQGETKQKIAKINANTAVLETERKGEKAAADSRLKSREIAIERELNLERIQAKRAAEQRDAELQKTVEQKKAEMELERLRATKVTQARIERESTQQKADADLYKQSKQADGMKYAQTMDAEATYYQQAKHSDMILYRREKEAQADFQARQREAEANLFSRQREAEANYIARSKEAAGLLELAKAYGALGEVFGGPQGLMQYMMLESGVYEKLANANARAVQGLNPKINVWTTGNQDGADPSAPIRNIFQNLPPLLSTIQDQTGMTPPAWLAQMPAKGAKNGSAQEVHSVKANSAKANGI